MMGPHDVLNLSANSENKIRNIPRKNCVVVVMVVAGVIVVVVGDRGGNDWRLVELK